MCAVADILASRKISAAGALPGKIDISQSQKTQFGKSRFASESMEILKFNFEVFLKASQKSDFIHKKFLLLSKISHLHIVFNVHLF